MGVALAAGNISATNKWAWSTNAGWVNFNPANGGVTVYNDHLEGYAWAENAGWIRLGAYTGGGTHTYLNTSNTNYGVNRNTGTGALSGYAWSTNAGWINFAPANGGVTVSAAGEFSGYAWGENIGWIKFNGTALNSTAYKVATAGPLAVTLADFSAVQQGDVVLLTWETNSELNNRGFNLYRGTSAAGPDRQLNETLIPSQSQGNPGGFIYTWEDRADLVVGATYFYWVEDVDIYGTTTMHGPVSVTMQTPTAVRLDGLDAASEPLAAMPNWRVVAAVLAAAAALAGLRRTQRSKW